MQGKREREKRKKRKGEMLIKTEENEKIRKYDTNEGRKRRNKKNIYINYGKICKEKKKGKKKKRKGETCKKIINEKRRKNDKNERKKRNQEKNMLRIRYERKIIMHMLQFNRNMELKRGREGGKWKERKRERETRCKGKQRRWKKRT